MWLGIELRILRAPDDHNLINTRRSMGQISAKSDCTGVLSLRFLSRRNSEAHLLRLLLGQFPQSRIRVRRAKLCLMFGEWSRDYLNKSVINQDRASASA